MGFGEDLTFPKRRWSPRASVCAHKTTLGGGLRTDPCLAKKKVRDEASDLELGCHQSANSTEPVALSGLLPHSIPKTVP
jgi:hypothetical protein